MSTTSDETAAVQTDDAAPEGASGSEEEHVELPSFEKELPPELAAFLDEDDDDITVSEDELDNLVAEHEEVPREMLARLAAAEKRAAHLEKLRVQDARKNWAEEAKTHFELAEPFLDEITATSRRAYLRTARQLHERMLPKYKETLAKYAAQTETVKEQATAEAKEDAKKAWGQVADDGGVPSEARVTLARSQERRRPRDLADTIKAMFTEGT